MSNPKGIDILSSRIIVSSEGTDKIHVWNSDGSYYGDFNTEVSDKGSMARPERDIPTETISTFQIQAEKLFWSTRKTVSL
ncbi:MAG: hypothetical protein R2883_07885 [Caldisericia bacterium]